MTLLSNPDLPARCYSQFLWRLISAVQQIFPNLYVLELGQGICEVKAIAGDGDLGGDDFDQVLLNHAAKKRREETKIDFAGLETPETDYLVGCGMDFNSECRDLKYIGAIQSYKPKKF